MLGKSYEQEDVQTGIAVVALCCVTISEDFEHLIRPLQCHQFSVQRCGDVLEVRVVRDLNSPGDE